MIRRAALLAAFLLAAAPSAPYGDETFGGWTPPETWATPTPTVAPATPAGSDCVHSQYVRGEDRCAKGDWTDWEYLLTLRDSEWVAKCHTLEDAQLGRRLDDTANRQYLLRKSHPDGGTVCRYWTRTRLP